MPIAYKGSFTPDAVRRNAIRPRKAPQPLWTNLKAVWYMAIGKHATDLLQLQVRH